MNLPESLYDVLENTVMLKQFRNFLKERLALENLLFYESILLYEQIDENKPHLRQKAGKFMVKQFILEGSEDCINIAFAVRNELIATKDFQLDTFLSTKKEVFDLMNNNFFSNFRRKLEGLECDSPPSFVLTGLSSIYHRDLSFTQLSEILKEDENGEISFTDCKCTAQKEEETRSRLYCCEEKRVNSKVRKLKQMVDRMTPSLLSRKQKTDSRNERNSTARSLSLWREVELEQELEL